MESGEREENLCDTLDKSLTINGESKTRHKRPDREFYVPPSANPSKAKVTKSKKSKPTKASSQKSSKSQGQSDGDKVDEKSTKENVKQADQYHQEKEPDNKAQQASTLSEKSEPSWDEIYDDDGDCIKPQIYEALRDKCDLKDGDDIQVEKARIDYLKFEVYEPSSDDDSKFAHVLEIYDFPSDLRTQDLVTSLSVFNSRDFDIKWVDDTHALAVFSSQNAAREAMEMPYNNIRLRPLSGAIKESKIKAQKCAEYLLPYKQRPQTSAVLARRLVTGALGLKTNVSPEQRAAERKRLQEAKEKRRMAIKQTQDAWEGTIG